MRFVLLFLLAWLPPVARAQEADTEPVKQVHWAAAAFFGTGWYRVDHNREVYVLRIPPRQVIRESAFEEGGGRKIGVEIKYPLTLGLHQLDDFPDFLEFDNYGSISFSPGVELEIPVQADWHLRPFAHFGFGYERKSGEWARVYYGGIRSRYRLDTGGRYDLSLINAVEFLGYKPEFADRGRFGSVMAGIEARHRLGQARVLGQPLWMNWHLTYDYLFDTLEFHVSQDELVKVEDQWELGIAFGRGEHRWKLGFISFQQIGVAYRWSSNRNYRAITFNVTSPFLR